MKSFRHKASLGVNYIYFNFTLHPFESGDAIIWFPSYEFSDGGVGQRLHNVYWAGNTGLGTEYAYYESFDMQKTYGWEMSPEGNRIWRTNNIILSADMKQLEKPKNTIL